MEIKAYVPVWQGTTEGDATQQTLSQHGIDVTMIRNPSWWFMDQWNYAKAQFGLSSATVFLYVMADVTLPADIGRMLGRIEDLMKTPDVGVYAPDIDWTGHVYDKRKLKQLINSYGENIWEVPNTDVLCVAIHRDVLFSVPHISPEINKHGWGVDYAVAAASRGLRLATVRDYDFLARHPHQVGYNTREADLQMYEMLKAFDVRLMRQIVNLIVEKHVKRGEGQ